MKKSKIILSLSLAIGTAILSSNIALADSPLVSNNSYEQLVSAIQKSISTQTGDKATTAQASLVVTQPGVASNLVPQTIAPVWAQPNVVVTPPSKDDPSRASLTVSQTSLINKPNDSDKDDSSTLKLTDKSKPNKDKNLVDVSINKNNPSTTNRLGTATRLKSIKNVYVLQTPKYGCEPGTMIIFNDLNKNNIIDAGEVTIYKVYGSSIDSDSYLKCTVNLWVKDNDNVIYVIEKAQS